MARPRLRSALLLGAVFATTVPLVALAVPTSSSPALHCGVKQVGFWERLPVDPFKNVNGLASPNLVKSYTVDEQRPQDLAVTNGVRIQTSDDLGCSWQDSLALSATPTGSQPFAGAVAKVVSLSLLQGKGVAAVQEGVGNAARPHVLVSSGGGWTSGDAGLPVAGAPGLLRAANDGRTLYLTISPTGARTGGGGGITTGLPGLPTTGLDVPGQTGLLYRSTDAGHSWAIATTAIAETTGGTGLSALDVDPANANRLFGIVSGHLAISSDGGQSFDTTTDSDYTAVTALGASTVVAFRSSGKLFYSDNGGSTSTSFAAPTGVTSAAFRQGDAAVLIERSGVLSRFSIFDDRLDAVPAGLTVNTGSGLGDRSSQASFHALAGNTILRYVDPVPKGTRIPPIAIGDTSVPPPVAGVIVPGVRNVTLPVGQSALEDFTLDLPKNPTPLDLYFMIDVSPSMSEYIANVKTNMSRIVAALTARGINLKVGVSTIGTGPRQGDYAWPRAYIYPPDPSHPLAPTPKYVKPVLYKRIRAVGSTGADLQKTINSVQVETDPNGVGPQDETREGILLGLKAASDGLGVHTEDEDRIRTPGYSEILPGENAGWRGSRAVRRIIVLATDEAFDIPYPTPQLAGSTPDDPRPDFGPAIKALKTARTEVVGLSAGSSDSLDDLRHVARGTGTFAPPGGIVCGADPASGILETIPAGDPLVCDNGAPADAIIRLLQGLVDRQSVSLVPLTQSPVLGALHGSSLLGLNVKQPNSATFQVNVSCVDVRAGRYSADVATILRSTQVGTARLNVTCVKALTVVPPHVVVPPGGANPPNPPVPANPPAPPVVPAPPPAVQVQPQIQPQVQPQVQVQPLSAGALQEQQELQLALAINGTGFGADDEAGFNPGAQMAMVDRRKRQEVQALYVLAFAMTTCAGLGLARLRSRPEISVRRAC